jgi:hypothetical protein
MEETANEEIIMNQLIKLKIRHKVMINLFFLILFSGSSVAQEIKGTDIFSKDTNEIKMNIDFLVGKCQVPNDFSNNLNLTPDDGWAAYKSILFHIYGKRTIKRQIPYFFYTYGDYYYYRGNLWGKMTKGGVFLLILEKNSGRILFIGHTK